MKTTIATIFLTLAATQVQADGFYQAVVANTAKPADEIRTDAGEFSYTPLYRQVTASQANFIDEEQKPSGEFTYTPLYNTVAGDPQDRIRNIADNNRDRAEDRI